MKKQIIGLTGHFASGKTSVANIFIEYGYMVIEVDTLGHKALKKKTNEIVKIFGKRILDIKSKQINRKELGQIVFKDKEKLRQLESILHPSMKEEVKDIIKYTKHNKILISAAILIEMGLEELCNYTILVWTPLNTIIERAMKRDKINKKQIQHILKNQLSLKNRLRFVDHIIRNDASYNELCNKTKAIILLLKGDKKEQGGSLYGQC